jgi:hypothetical protein
MVATERTFSHQIRHTGDARGWDDWMFPAIIVNLPGIADPRFAKWLDDGAGSAGVWGWFFDVNEVAPLVTQQLPHRWALATDIKPHIHFRWVTAPAVGETVTWDVESTVAAIDAVHPATTGHLTGTYTATAADVVRRHVICPLTPDIAAAVLGISALMDVTIKRAGTHAHEVFLGGFDLHYLSDGLGSDGEHTKTA